MTQKFSARVYYVFSKDDDTVLIALDVSVDDKWVRWFDTIKERMMGIGKIIDPNPRNFVFERALSEGGKTYTFIPMTLAIYNEKVKGHILVPQDFTDEESLFKAFEETKNNAW